MDYANAFDGVADFVGNAFDFGGRTNLPPQEELQGGEPSAVLGIVPAGAALAVGKTFSNRFLKDALDGEDLLGEDLAEYVPGALGGFGGVNLTEAGRKWALIAFAAVVGLYLASRGGR